MMERVSTLKKHLAKGRETGHVLIMVLILLAIGSILIAPVMSFMGTGIKAGGVYEIKTGQLYAADAGVEDARWQIQNNGDGLLLGNPANFNYQNEFTYYIRDDIFVSGLPPYVIFDENAGSMNAFDETGNLIDLYTLIDDEMLLIEKLYDAEGNRITIYDIEYEKILDEENNIIGYGDLINVYIKIGGDFIQILNIYIDGEGEPAQIKNIYCSVFYTLPELVNNHTVDVNLTRFNREIYIIQSTAGGETSTTITVWTGDKVGDYSSITDHIVCTIGKIDAKNNVDLIYDPDVNPPFEFWPEDSWPTTMNEIEEFKQFFYWDVRNEEPYAYDTIDLAGLDRSEGPLYRDGTMDIYNSPNTLATLTLDGTLYITGKTKIGNEKQSMNLDLNGNTIFVESNLTGGAGPALWIGKKCNLIGPGAIVAMGDIYFEPNIISGEEGPIFIMSVSGTTALQPGGNFYGAIAGEFSVELKSGVTIEYPEDGFPPLNFPGLHSYPKIWGILTYNID